MTPVQNENPAIQINMQSNELEGSRALQPFWVAPPEIQWAPRAPLRMATHRATSYSQVSKETHPPTTAAKMQITQYKVIAVNDRCGQYSQTALRVLCKWLYIKWCHCIREKLKPFPNIKTTTVEKGFSLKIHSWCFGRDNARYAQRWQETPSMIQKPSSTRCVVQSGT